MSADSDYKLKVTTEGDPAGLEKVIKVAQQAGLDTADLEKELAKLKETAAKTSLDRYRAELAQAIEKMKQAGGDVGSLQRQLAALTPAATESAEGARTLADDLATLGSRNNETKDVVEGLDAALKGNLNSIFGVAKAVTNLGEILTVSTPAGRALQLALIAINAAAMVLPHVLNDAAEAEKKTGDAAGAAAPKVDRLAEALKKSNEAKLEGLSKALASIKNEADATAKELERVRDLRDQLTKSGFELERARINNNSKLSEDEKKKALAMVDQRQADAERLSQDTKLADDWRAAEQNVKALQSQAATIDDQRQKAEDRAKELGQTRTAGLAEEKTALQTEREQIKNLVHGDDPVAAGHFSVRLKEIDDRLVQIEASKGDEALVQAKVDEQKELAAALKEEAKKVAEDIRQAMEAFRLLGSGVQGFRNDGSAIPDPRVLWRRMEEDRKRRQDAGLPEPASNLTTGNRVMELYPRRTSVIDSRSAAAQAKAEGRPVSEVVQDMVDDAAGIPRRSRPDLQGQTFSADGAPLEARAQELRQQLNSGRHYVNYDSLARALLGVKEAITENIEQQKMTQDELDRMSRELDELSGYVRTNNRSN